MRILSCLMVAVALGLPSVAIAQGGGVTVDRAWSRASAGKTGAVYLTIRNQGDDADALVDVTSPAAARAEVHQTVDEDGVMKMHHVERLVVAPGGTVALAPGGYHIMLMGLTAPLKEGETVPVTLRFERAGEIEVMADVGAAGAVAPPD
jgi:copper(I)-binding protein